MYTRLKNKIVKFTLKEWSAGKSEYYVKNGIIYVLFTIQDLSLRKLEINNKRVVPLFKVQEDKETSYSYLMK